MLQRFQAFRARLVAVLGFIAVLGLSSSPASAAQCNRACLGGMITLYINALVQHEPGRLPVAVLFRFTENSKAIRLSQGLWRTVTGKGDFRQNYLDPEKQIAASHILLMEDNIPVLFSLVLHVNDMRIVGIETTVQRILPTSKFQPTQLGKPLPGMNDPVPADKRQSRESMVATALTYPEGLKIGSFVTAQTPFAPEGYRIENGIVTAGTGCGRADCTMQTQTILKHPDIKASVAAVDEQNGVVLLWMNFGDTGSYGPGNALVALEAFKIWGGQIHAVNAFFPFLPVATMRGWPSTDPVPADLQQAE